MSKGRDFYRDDRRLDAARDIDVYAADTSLGYRIVRQVTPMRAYEKVIAGQWRELFDDMGNFFGVQVVAAVKTDQDLPSGTSASYITPKESRIYVGLEGRSETIGRNEEYRITHTNRFTGRPEPEDRIERVIAKVQQWPFPASRIDNGCGPMQFGDRAIRVYPRFK